MVGRTVEEASSNGTRLAIPYVCTQSGQNLLDSIEAKHSGRVI